MNPKATGMAFLAGTISMVVLAGCLVPGRYGEPVLVVPPLPALVVFDREPYYAQNGYHYHYRDGGWYYSRSRNGPWSDLPRDRYPNEIRYKHGKPDDDGGRGRNPGHKGR